MKQLNISKPPSKIVEIPSGAQKGQGADQRAGKFKGKYYN